MRLASQWAFRLYMEEKICTSSHFVTLTYDQENVPITKKGWMSLDAGKHLTLFFKTLRNQYRYRGFNPKTGKKKWYYDKVPKIRYFAVGEYGGKTLRPHYHAIILNSHEQKIIDSWKYGGVHVGQVTQGSIMYTLKYVMKDGKIPIHQNDDRIPEYRRSSLKLGLNYLSSAVIKFHRQNPLAHYIVMEGGFKLAIPRYFREKIWQKEELQKINEQIACYFEKINQTQEKIHNSKNEKPYDDYTREQSEYRHKRSIQRTKSNRKL